MIFMRDVVPVSVMHTSSFDFRLCVFPMQEVDEFFEQEKTFLLDYYSKIKDSTGKAEKMTRAHKSMSWISSSQRFHSSNCQICSVFFNAASQDLPPAKIMQLTAKTEAFLDLPHVWKGTKVNSEPEALRWSQSVEQSVVERLPLTCEKYHRTEQFVF